MRHAHRIRRGIDRISRGRYRLGCMLAVSLAMSGCNMAMEPLPADQAQQAIEDPEEVLYTFVDSLAGELPPPANVVGATAIAAFWPQQDATAIAIDGMNAKLDSIQGQLSSIQSQLSSLRAGVLADFELFFQDRDRSTIRATVNHVTHEINEDYVFLKSTGELSSDYLNGEIKPLEELLAESIDWFLFDEDLSPRQKMSTAAEFIMMASLQLSLIQEQIDLYRAENYRPCPGGACEPRQALLEAYVNKLTTKIDRYTAYLLEARAEIKRFRLSLWEIISTPIYETQWQCFPGLGCLETRVRVGTRYTLFDNGSSPSLIGSATSHADIIAAKDSYLRLLADWTEDDLAEKLDTVLDGFANLKESLRDIDEVVAYDCVRFFKDPDLGGDYAEACGLQRVSQMHLTLGSGWDDTLSSVKVGKDVDVIVYDWRYSGDYFDGDHRTITSLQQVNLSELGFDNVASAFIITPNAQRRVQIPANCVRFFTEPGYAGQYAERCGAEEAPWIVSALASQNWHNSISSILVGSDVRLQVYDNAYAGSFGGPNITFEPGSELPDLGEIGWDDMIAAFIITE